jgi:pimeloyl-ACP methyl ester carboxylesterase
VKHGRRVAATVAVLFLASCGGGSRDAAEFPRAPSLGERCQRPAHEGRTLWFRASDGTRLAGAVFGDGELGVVLAHGYPSDLCEWIDYAQVLAERGFRVLAFDFRGFGLSRLGSQPDYLADVRGAAGELRRLGASRVALMGSSFGGTTVLAAAPTVRPAPAGVISLSGPLGFSAVRVARRLPSRALLVYARGDAAFAPRETRAYARSAAADVDIALYPGSWHATNMLYEAPYRNRVSRLVLDFLRGLATG